MEYVYKEMEGTHFNIFTLYLTHPFNIQSWNCMLVAFQLAHQKLQFQVTGLWFC